MIYKKKKWNITGVCMLLILEVHDINIVATFGDFPSAHARLGISPVVRSMNNETH